MCRLQPLTRRRCVSGRHLRLAARQCALCRESCAGIPDACPWPVHFAIPSSPLNNQTALQFGDGSEDGRDHLAGGRGCIQRLRQFPEGGQRSCRGAALGLNRGIENLTFQVAEKRAVTNLNGLLSPISALLSPSIARFSLSHRRVPRQFSEPFGETRQLRFERHACSASFIKVSVSAHNL